MANIRMPPSSLSKKETVNPNILKLWKIWCSCIQTEAQKKRKDGKYHRIPNLWGWKKKLCLVTLNVPVKKEDRVWPSIYDLQFLTWHLYDPKYDLYFFHIKYSTYTWRTVSFQGIYYKIKEKVSNGCFSFQESMIFFIVLMGKSKLVSSVWATDTVNSAPSVGIPHRCIGFGRSYSSTISFVLTGSLSNRQGLRIRSVLL